MKLKSISSSSSSSSSSPSPSPSRRRSRNQAPLMANIIPSLILLPILLIFAPTQGQAAPKLSFNDLYNIHQPGNHAHHGHHPQSRSGADLDPHHNQPHCGYSSCPLTNPDKLNIHLVAHSHDDVGWLKTVDQYYYNTNNVYAPVGVEYIYDSVIPELVMDPNKRFIAVEMGFFTRWWHEQDDRMKGIVKRLVNEGRLEFINGGWCMNDEASTNYQSTIEQMTLGLKFLNETFGVCGHPKVGWQIDPFGHTNEQASLFAQFGFDGMYFTRISYEDKEHRKKNRTLDLLWHGDVALSGQTGSIFTNIFRDGYDAPQNFCFDVQCHEDHLVDNKKSYEYNIDKKAVEFVDYLLTYAKMKEHNHILLPMGGDFQYTAASHNFKNIDKLMKFIKNTPEYSKDINIFYSTPTCYQHSVFEWFKQQQANASQSSPGSIISGASISSKRKIAEKFDDFMPYDSTPTVWWSGYFTSKPSVKLIERDTANLLQVSRFISLANLLRHGNSTSGSWSANVKQHENKCLLPLWEILGDLQHHDAITGTAKDHVDRDYIRRVVDANNLCAKFVGDLRRHRINDHLKKSPNYEILRESGKRFKLDPVYLEDTQFCPYLNISQCDAIEANVDPQNYIDMLAINTMTTNHTNHHSAPMKPTERSAATIQQSILDQTSRMLNNMVNNHHLHPGSAHHSNHHQTERHTSLRQRYLSKVSRSSEAIPSELETKANLVNVYNPLAKPISQHDIRLPCAGECDLTKVKVIHLSTNETMRLTRLRLPAGVVQLPFRNALTSYEVLFYANIPALGYSSYVFEDLNKDEFIEEDIESAYVTESSISSNEPLQHPETTHHTGSFASHHHHQRRDVSQLQDSGDIDAYLSKNCDGHEGTCDLAEIDLNLSKFNNNNNYNHNHNHNRNRNRRSSNRARRDSSSTSQQQSQGSPDRVIVKFDLGSGMIVGLKRVSDGSLLNITQKFGYYFPANSMARPGAYIFRTNTSEPYLFDKPIKYKMYKRKNGSFIEIHQKWLDWIWQTIRVDSKKNYIEFDYVVGPIPLNSRTANSWSGVELVTRYITGMTNNGLFLTDSNDRQLMARHRLRTSVPEQLGGSFYPVVSTIMLKSTEHAGNSSSNHHATSSSSLKKNVADAVAVIVDRPQAGTSLNEGQLELLIHRRHLIDDNFGVAEALDEPGEDGRGLIIRGKHKVYIKFQEIKPPTAPPTPPPEPQPDMPQNDEAEKELPKVQLFKLPQSGRANLEYEKLHYSERADSQDPMAKYMVLPNLAPSIQTRSNTHSAVHVQSAATYVAHDTIYNDLNQESKKQTLKPLLTFDRLRVNAHEFVEMVSSYNDGNKLKTDLSLLNSSLPNNIHVLTLQPWSSGNNQILIRLENLDNPLTIHPFPDFENYLNLLKTYRTVSEIKTVDPDDLCQESLRPRTEFDIEYLIKRIRIVELEEMVLGGNAKLSDVKRLNWFGEEELDLKSCDIGIKPTSIKLAPRQIRTFLAKFTYL